MPKIKLIYIFQINLLIISSLSFVACNQGITGKFYHNMTAQFNPYFIARNRLDSVELDIFMSRKDNYNRVLDVMPIEDTSALRKYDPKLEDCLKKAYIVHNRHEESKLLDASYIVIGKARFYLRKYEKAIEILKYVNVKGKEPEDQNRALIELLYVYTELDDERAAATVLNAFRTRDLGKEKTEFYLARGHFYRRQNDYLETAKSLGSAVLEMPRGERRGRIYFILGQIYQRLGKNDLARSNYLEVLKNNPPYELAFFARLYANQVTEINADTDTRKAQRYYKKLLRDLKNKEYQDKIYYEMGMFALRQNKIDEAMAHLQQALRVPQPNPLQKAYTYLKIAEINYKPLRKYEEAKMYYDSVMTALPKNAEEYPAVEKRQKTLLEFVKYLNEYRLCDSLQRLAQMPEAERNEFIAKQLVAEESKKYDREDSLRKVQEKIAERNRNRTPEVGTLDEQLQANTSTGWYFDNPTAVQRGLNDFRRKWNNRPLEDNWRRSNKVVVGNGNNPENPAITEINIDPVEIRKTAIEKRVTERTESILAALPTKPAQMDSLDKLIETDLFELGKINRFKLDEPENAIVDLEKLLQRFPKSQYEPETLYILYLANQDLNKTGKQEEYKRLILSKFPNSSFAKLLQNPNYLAEVRANDDSAKAIYKRAYGYYEAANYAQAIGEISRIEKEYAENSILDKVQLLQLILNFKLTGKKEEFKITLEKFKEQYPESTLLVYVDGLIKQTEK
jgi:tetratricopeptide (TPR) repeat protein